MIKNLFVFIFCLPPSVSQGTKYLRLPSGFTFPDPASYKTSSYIYKPSEGVQTAEYKIQRPIPPSSPPRAHLGHQIAEIPGSAYVVAGSNNPETTIIPDTGTIYPEGVVTSANNHKELEVDQFKEIISKKKGEIEKVEGAGALLPEEGEGTLSENAEHTEKGEVDLEVVKEAGSFKKKGIIKTVDAKDKNKVIQNLHIAKGHVSESQKNQNLGGILASLGGGQFYQSIFGGRNGFSPLQFFLNAGGGRGGGSGGGSNPFIVPVPIVVPPPPPPPPGPKCYTNPSGFLCCNVTLEKVMEDAFVAVKEEGVSSCNAQKMATAVQEAAETKFGTTFESIVAHKDFVAKVNFAGDLNCKIEIDGKFILAYATPSKESEVNIIDANSFFSGDAEELFSLNETESGKPTYIVYGPI